MANDGFYTYKENRMVTLPTASSSIAIEKREWDRLKKEVEKCKVGGQWFMSVGFCFFGICGSAFITWLSLSEETLKNERTILMIVTLVALVLGVLCIIFQVVLNYNKKSSIETIKDEIAFIEDGIGQTSSSAIPTSDSNALQKVHNS